MREREIDKDVVRFRCTGELYFESPYLNEVALAETQFFHVFVHCVEAVIEGILQAVDIAARPILLGKSESLRDAH